MSKGLKVEGVTLTPKQIKKVLGCLPLGATPTKIVKAEALDTFKQYDHRVKVFYLYNSEERFSNLSYHLCGRE